MLFGTLYICLSESTRVTLITTVAIRPTVTQKFVDFIA